MAKNNYGECALCGKYRRLTFEHVPPRSAFNDKPIMQYTLQDNLKNIASETKPWDLTSMKGKIQQQGKGGYFLCSQCNENTGSWYVPHLAQFIHGIFGAIHSIDTTERDSIVVQIERFRPMPLLKEILVMFCDINHNTFGDEKLRKYLSERDCSEGFNEKKYRVFCHITKGSIGRQAGLSVIAKNVIESHAIQYCVSEIISYPLGFTLYLDLPAEYIPVGTEITPFSRFMYNDTVNGMLRLPLLECNSIIPTDYRSKEEITRCIEGNEQWNQEYGEIKLKLVQKMNEDS